MDDATIMVFHCDRAQSDYELPLDEWRSVSDRNATCPGCGQRIWLTSYPGERVTDRAKAPKHYRVEAK